MNVHFKSALKLRQLNLNFEVERITTAGNEGGKVKIYTLGSIKSSFLSPSRIIYISRGKRYPTLC